MDLTIIVSTYNRAGSLDNCLGSLCNQTDKKFKIIIVDGRSTDSTLKVISKYRKKLSIRVIVDEAFHLAYIRDLGWRGANTDLVGWIDDDVVVSKDWVKSVKNAFKVEPLGSFKARPFLVAGVSGPTVIPKKLLSKRDVFYFHRLPIEHSRGVINHTPGMFIRLYFNLFMQGEKYGIGKIYSSGAWSPGSNFSQSLKLKSPIEVAYLEACNFVVRKSVLQAVGGFDLKYIGTSEWCEVDLAFRMRKLGYKLFFDPKICVEHHISTCGVYIRRKEVVHRLKNFLRFYLFSYYPKSIKGWGLFFLYFLYLVIYYLYLLVRKYR